jgi:hypothetical protein
MMRGWSAAKRRYAEGSFFSRTFVPSTASMCEKVTGNRGATGRLGGEQADSR